jgi:hypothetical protein
VRQLGPLPVEPGQTAYLTARPDQCALLEA